MWQAPNQRSRALISAKKRERERLRRPLHLKRVMAELKASDPTGAQQTISSARVLLNDISPRGVGLFCAEAYLPGMEVALTLESPKRIYLRGRIAWCQEYDVDSKVLSQSQFSFRIGIQFVFESDEEAKAIRALCEEIFKEYLFAARAA